MVITFKPGKSNKIHISLDGEYAATTTAEYWYTLGIANGDEIGEEAWNKLLFEIEERRAYGRALGLLEVRDRSRRELSTKLFQKLLPSAADKDRLSQQIANVCDKLEELGLLDDSRFAKLYVEDLIRRKHLSPRGLRSALAAKGIDRDTIDSVLADIEIDSKEEIIILLRTKYKNRDLLAEGDINRTFNALLRLGYSYSEIKSAIYDYTDGFTTDFID